jgi:PAS domain S-box-containing protein
MAGREARKSNNLPMNAGQVTAAPEAPAHPLAIAVDQATIGVALVGLDGIGLRANRAFCELTGYSEAELRERSFAAITHPDDVRATLEGDRKLLEGRTPEYRLEKRYRRREGGSVWVHVVVSLVRDEDGTPLHYLVYANDISLRKRIEAELVDETRGGRPERELMCVTAATGAIERLEGDWEAVLGRDVGEIRGRGLLTSIHPGDRAETEAQIAALGAEPGLWRTFRNRWKSRDGAWCALSWTAFGLGEGRIFWSVRSIDDQLALARASELRGRVIETMSEGVVLIAANHMRIVYANPSLERMFGYTRGELDGRDAVELTRPSDLSAAEEEALDSTLDQFRTRGGGVFEGRRRRRDGSEFWARIETTTFDHPRLGPIWVGIVEDATARRRASEAAAELEQAKTRFLASVSHELRTPLTSIRGYLALLRKDPAFADGKAREHLDVIERNAVRQARLVEDLLSIARIEAGEFAVERRPIDFAIVAGVAIEAQRPSAATAELRLTDEIHCAAPILGDHDRLDQVVGNLIANAIKVTPAGGEITVSLVTVADSAVLRVSDTGPGIPEESLTRVFDGFHRSEEMRRRRIEGAGLGLTISRSIVEAHEGRIRAFNGRRGAVFEVILPLR